jgi:hypothetical protein
MNKIKIVERLNKIASSLDSIGRSDLADICDSVSKDIIISLAQKPSPTRAQTYGSGVAGAVGGTAGGYGGAYVGSYFGDTDEEKQKNAERGAIVGGIAGDVGASALANRLMMGPGANVGLGRSLLRSAPAVAGGLEGAQLGAELGYELGGEAGAAVGGLGGFMAGHAGTNAAISGGTAAAKTLAGLSGTGVAGVTGTAGVAAGAAGVALAGALGYALGTGFVKAFPSLGTFGADWVQKAIGSHDPVFVEQIEDYLKAAQQSRDADTVIRNLSKAQFALGLYEKDYTGELSRKEMDGVAALQNAIGGIRGYLPEEFRAEYDARVKKLNARLQSMK